MARTKLKLYANINGFASLIGEIKIAKYADEKKPVFERVCPTCGKKPQWVGGYNCDCGGHFDHWSKLKMMFNGKEVIKPKLTSTGEATLFIIDRNAFNVHDATQGEYGITVTDNNTAKNLKRLLIATDLLGKVIVIKWNSTYEETIGLLTLTASKRVIIKELIPINLLIQKETMQVDFNDLTEKELNEAKVFVDLIKTTTPIAEILTVNDYRATGLVEADDAVPDAGIETVKSLEDLIKATTPATN